MKGATRAIFARPVEREALKRQHHSHCNYKSLNELLPPSQQFLQEEQAARNLLRALFASEVAPDARARLQKRR